MLEKWAVIVAGFLLVSCYRSKQGFGCNQFVLEQFLGRQSLR
jgi:hypothetical protein